MTREAVLGALALDLAAAGTGISFVYRALDRVAEHLGISDAVVVVDEPPAGRQLFRLGRQPVDGFATPELIERGGTGIYTEPMVLDDSLAAAVTAMCSVAIRLDLVRHDAARDPLTGLFNRRSFDALLDQSLARSQRYGWPFRLVLLDLDGFKAVNDQLGHDRGDAVLRTIGAELRRSLRAGDTAARVGGDEFALLLHNSGDEKLLELVGRLEVAVNDTLSDVAIGFSAGSASAPDEASDASALYRLADARLYDSKKR